MSLNAPNLDQITHESPRLGETLKNFQTYINNNVSPAVGNKKAPPPKSLANPSNRL